MSVRTYSLLNQSLSERAKSSEYLADALQILVQTAQDMKERRQYKQSTDEFVRTVFLTLLTDVYGLLQELRWMPWALKDSRGRRRRVNQQDITKKAADILTSLGAMLVILQEDYGVVPRDIMEVVSSEVSHTAERLKDQRV